MSRYTIETPTGKQLAVEDFMITDMGLEAVQVLDDSVVMVLFLGDGTIIYDYESGKTKDDIKKAREEYSKIAQHQQETFRERANQIIREAVEQGKDPSKMVGDPEDDDPDIPYHTPPGPEPAGYA